MALVAIPVVGGGSRVFVETKAGVGPWTFSSLNGDETGLLGYEFELAIVDPTTDIVLRINGDATNKYAGTAGVAVTQAVVGPYPGGPPGAVRGVVELRGVVTGSIRSIGVARVTSIDPSTPQVVARPGDFCYTATAALASVSIYASGGAAGATSAVSLFKIMKAG